MSGQTLNLTISDRLSRHLARPVDEQSRQRAILHVLDWAGCAVAGAKSPAGLTLKAALGNKSSLDDALFLGALGNTLELDDVDKRALLHPGPVVIPAALVAARQSGGSGQVFLDAIVRGYEAMIRVGRGVGLEHYKIWHNTSTCGPFGAVAAAGSILGLTPDEMSGAIGLAGTQSAGPWQVRHEPLTHGKQLHAGRAAHAGLLAARLVSNNFVGLKTIFEGEQGFFKAMCGEREPSSIVDFDVNAPWVIHDVSFKPWPACRHAHAAIDCALALAAEGVDVEGIEEIKLETYRDAMTFCNNANPTDTLSAKFSLQHSVAIVLTRGQPTLADFEEEARNNVDIKKLREHIKVSEDKDLTQRYPGRFGTTLIADLKNGSRKTIQMNDALGDPENPVDKAILIEKASMLMAEGGLRLDEISMLQVAIEGLSNSTIEEFSTLIDRAVSE